MKRLSVANILNYIVHKVYNLSQKLLLGFFFPYKETR